MGAAMGMILVAAWPAAWLPLASGALIGAMLPDIDHPQSKLGRKARPLSDIVYATMGHRAGTHSLLFVLVLSALVSLFSLPASVGLAAGLLLHLIGDAVSYSSGRRLTTRGVGVPLGWPFVNERAGIRIVVVDGVAERLLILPLCWLLALGAAGLVAAKPQ